MQITDPVADMLTRIRNANNATIGKVESDGTIRNAREHQSPHYTTLWSDIPGVKVE